MPDSISARSGTEAAAAPAQPATGDDDSLMDEYAKLARALAPVRARAMRDPDLAADWSDLNGLVEARLIEVSPVYRQLASRRDELEREIDEALESGQEMDEEKRAELARFYRNVQYDLTRMRSEELQKPEYSERLRAFQGQVYAEMRKLQPGRIVEIDRMEALEERLFQPTDTLPPIPGLRVRG